MKTYLFPLESFSIAKFVLLTRNSKSRDPQVFNIKLFQFILLVSFCDNSQVRACEGNERLVNTQDLKHFPRLLRNVLIVIISTAKLKKRLK